MSYPKLGTKSQTAMYGERSFRVSAPRLWNKLPNHIKLEPIDIILRFLKHTYLNWRIYNI